MFDNTVDLSNLRDIHLPNNISIFPLALGWWLILGFISALLLLPIIIKLFRKRHIITTKKNAFKELALLEDSYHQNQNLQNIAVLLSRLIKRIALLKYNKEFIAKLHSESWSDFLVKTGYDDQKTALIISNAPYLDKNNFDAKSAESDNIKMFAATRKWIDQNI